MQRSTIRSYALHVLALLVFAAGMTVSPAQAQDENAYKKKFNEGLKVAKSGQEALKADNTNEGISKFDESIAILEEAAQMASQAEDSEVAGKANYVASQLAYTSGRALLNQDNNERALQYFEKGTELYPKYAKNFRGKGLALKKLERGDEAMASYKKAIEVGENNGDYDTASKAEEGIRDYYVYRASQLLSAENPTTANADQALEHLNKIEQYVEPGSKAYYYMAVAHNVKNNHSQAASYADRAIAASTGSRSDEARLYFEKGRALMNSGNQDAACGAFQNANYGDVKSRAQYNMKQLECPGASSS